MRTAGHRRLDPVHGQRIERMPPEKIAKMASCRSSKAAGFEHLTVEQNLKVGAHMRKFGRSIKEGWRWSITTFAAAPEAQRDRWPSSAVANSR